MLSKHKMWDGEWQKNYKILGNAQNPVGFLGESPSRGPMTKGGCSCTVRS